MEEKSKENLNDVECISYTNDHKIIVKECIKKGNIKQIKDILLGEEIDEKKSFLFCLDWFLDSYYGQDVSSIHDELIDFLQEFILLNVDDFSLAREALDLFMYEEPPYLILENNIDSLPDKIKNELLDLINPED